MRKRERESLLFSKEKRLSLYAIVDLAGKSKRIIIGGGMIGRIEGWKERVGRGRIIKD